MLYFDSCSCYKDGTPIASVGYTVTEGNPVFTGGELVALEAHAFRYQNIYCSNGEPFYLEMECSTTASSNSTNITGINPDLTLFSISLDTTEIKIKKANGDNALVSPYAANSVIKIFMSIVDASTISVYASINAQVIEYTDAVSYQGKQVEIVQNQGSGGGSYISNIIMTDELTARPEAVEIQTVYPDSDVAVEFTPSTGSDNFACVNDPQDDGTYNAGGEGQQDVFGKTLPVTEAVIGGVNFHLRHKSTDGNGRITAVFDDGSGVTEIADAVDSGTDFKETVQEASVNPNTGVRWTVAEINALTFGYKNMPPPPPDEFTKVLIHSNTTDGDTVFVNSSQFDHPIVTHGGAKHSTDQAKFGTSSIYPARVSNTDSGYISTHNSPDFDVGAGDFTIDLWAYVNNIEHMPTLCGKWNNNGSSDFDSAFQLTFNSSKLYYAYTLDGSSRLDIDSVDVFPASTWTHVAVVKSGTTIMLFINGTLKDSKSEPGTLYHSSRALTIGALPIDHDGDIIGGVDGYIDEFRFSKGIARWTANFTPPTEPY